MYIYKLLFVGGMRSRVAPHGEMSRRRGDSRIARVRGDHKSQQPPIYGVRGIVAPYGEMSA